MKYQKVRNFINGEFLDSDARETLEVTSPIDGTLLSEVPMSTHGELNRAVASAKIAFETWSEVPIKERVQVFFRYRYLLEKYSDELTELVAEENGKTLDEARAEVDKSIELTEFAVAGFEVEPFCSFIVAANFQSHSEATLFTRRMLAGFQ